MPKAETKRLMTSPHVLTLGSIYAGSGIRGSFLIPSAKACQGYYDLDTKRPVPNWLTLKGPIKTDQGLVWNYAIRAHKLGHRVASLRFKCDNGIAHWPLLMDVVAGPAPLGDVAFWPSPLQYLVPYSCMKSLLRICGALPVAIHCVDSLTHIRGLALRTLVLHDSALAKVTAKEINAVLGLVGTGTNVIVLADEFFQGTVRAANQILTPFGLAMNQNSVKPQHFREANAGPRDRDGERRANLTEVVSAERDVCTHRLTRGVKRVLWCEPCPINCRVGHGIPLVRNPLHRDECFAAISAGAAKEKGSVIAIGTSLWSSLSSVGWPYDNDRFLANILLGDDVESWEKTNWTQLSCRK
jgi:hypothetical protein